MLIPFVDSPRDCVLVWCRRVAAIELVNLTAIRSASPEAGVIETFFITQTSICLTLISHTGVSLQAMRFTRLNATLANLISLPTQMGTPIPG